MLQAQRKVREKLGERASWTHLHLWARGNLRRWKTFRKCFGPCDCLP